LILTITALSFSQVYAVPSVWVSGGDGYGYYRMPSAVTTAPPTVITITVQPNEYLEVFDFVFNNYVPIEEKTIKLRFYRPPSSSWDELWYEYGDKNFSAISYSDYSYIFSI